MKIKLRSVHFDADRKLTEFINSKITKIEKIFDRVIDANVVLSLENSGQVKDKIAELSVRVPGKIIISKGESKTFEKAFDIAMSNCKRQIKRYKERLQAKN